VAAPPPPGGGGEAGVAVRGDRVALGAVGDLAHDERGEELDAVAGDPQGVGGGLGVEEGSRAEELVRNGGFAAVFQ
jgi:hypothetical protein